MGANILWTFWYWRAQKMYYSTSHHLFRFPYSYIYQIGLTTKSTDTDLRYNKFLKVKFLNYNILHSCIKKKETFGGLLS